MEKEQVQSKTFVSDLVNDLKISRRGFVKVTAATGAALALGTGLTPDLRALAQTGKAAGGEMGQWIASTCQGCTSWCSKEVYVVNGRAIKVHGNKRSKVNGGASCPRAHLALQQVYDPDRIKTPMKRTNPKKGRTEDPKFVPISWDEALNTIADKVMELRKNNETHKYLLLRGRYTYMRDIIYDAMTKIIGSPNNISHSAICAEAEKFGPFYTEGYWDYRQYDVLNTKYLLIWGADPLAANRQVSYYSSVWGDVVGKATIAVVEPRLSATAGKADEWLPIKPGQDGALAAAIAHVLLTKGMWSKEFVGDFKEGKNLFVAGQEVDPETFEEKHTYGIVRFWNLELKDKTPEWAAERAGLPVDQIMRVAMDYGKAGSQSISWVGGGPVMQVRGAYASMICHCLNGITGACDNVGGTLVNNKEYTVGFPPFEEFMDETAKKGSKQGKIDHRGRKDFPCITSGRPGSSVVTNRAADGILNADPYDIKVAIAYMNNFNFSCTQPERWNQALAKIPFLVHITTNASEFSWFADILLPDTHSPIREVGLGEVQRQRLPPRHFDAAGDQAHVGVQDRRDRNPLADRRKTGGKRVRQHAALLQDDQGSGNRQGAGQRQGVCALLREIHHPGPVGPGQVPGRGQDQWLGGVPQGRRLELSPLSFPQALECHEHQDQEVRVLQRDPQGRAGRACQEAQYHGGRYPGGQRLPGERRAGVRPALRGAFDPW